MLRRCGLRLCSLAAAAPSSSFSADRKLLTFATRTTQSRCLHFGPAVLSREAVRRQQVEFEELLARQPRRHTRKRRPITAQLQPADARLPQVVSIALSEQLNMADVAADPAINNMYNCTVIDEEFDDALHLVKRLEYQIDPTQLSEVFVYEDGVVVFWNVDSPQRVALLRELENHMLQPYDSTVAHAELDSMPFVVDMDSARSRIRSERFVLDGTKHGGANHLAFDSVLERYALSHAFAASVKVGVWEAMLASHAEPLSKTTKDLMRGVIPWSRQEALRKAGDFADLRHSININCNLLNRDFYWERTELEKYYEMTARHLTVERRLKLLNSKLDYCEELVKMVDNMLALRHASTLEWLIIVLILIEVAFDIFHYVESFSPQKVIVVADPELTVVGAETAEKK